MNRVTSTARHALEAAYHATVNYLTSQLRKDDEKDKQEQSNRLVDGLPLTALADIVTQDELSGIAEDGANQFLAQISVPDQDIFGQVNERAVMYAKDRAAELVSGLDETTRDELREIIATSLQDNEGLQTLIDRIKTSYSFSKERAQLIAQTEVAMANQHGALAGMRLARLAGVEIKKLWLPDAIACPLCVENGEDGAIELEATFSGTGDLAPPGHPRCRCALASEIEE